MHIGVILLVVEEDLVIEDNLVTFLSVFVPWGYLECDSACHWIISQLQLLTCLVFFGGLFGELQKLAASLMAQLYLHAIEDHVSSLIYEAMLIALALRVHSLLQHL